MEVYNQLKILCPSLDDDNAIFEKLFNAITDVSQNLKLGFTNLLIKDFKTY